MGPKARLPSLVGQRQALDGEQAPSADVAVDVLAGLARQRRVEGQVAPPPPEARAVGVAIVEARAAAGAEGRVFAVDPERVQIDVGPLGAGRDDQAGGESLKALGVVDLFVEGSAP